MKKNINYIVVIISILFLGHVDLYGQVTNNLCETAIKIQDPKNWCSSKGQFTNSGADDSEFLAPTCWSAPINDVWFSFIAVATDVRVTINGQSIIASGGSLIRPEVALYYESCGSTTVNNLECQQAPSTSNIVELYQGGLIIGATYYIRVDGFSANMGSFQICINNYNPPADVSSDCIDAAILCDKSAFVVENIVGAGNDQQEIPNSSCFGTGINGVSLESNSIWMKWTCDESGSLTMTLTPSKEVDDLDFIIFELTDGVNGCGNKVILRCMAAGAPESAYPSKCLGPTGLNFDASDISENAGCSEGQNNWLAPLDMVAGKSYALIVNNYTSTDQGFDIEFGGTGTFLGPDANFGFDPPEIKCLETVQISDSSSFDLGAIVSWEWNFGEDADPQIESGQGPFDVTYNSFGIKSVVLTIESDEGCRITKIIEYYVDECCSPDVDNLNINVINVEDIVCNGDSTGLIEIEGNMGNPWYKFSIDNQDYYQFGTTFAHLPAGDYVIDAFDRLGCVSQIPVTVGTAPPLIIDAGPDQTVDLGYDAFLQSTLSPFDRPVDYVWSPDTLMECFDCPATQIVPPGTTTYTIMVTDEDGCVSLDKVTIFVNDKRPIHIPTGFHPDYDGYNDYFTIYGERAAVEISELNVYDRWGGLIFKGEKLPMGIASQGWDGTFKGEPVGSGVYTYYAKVLFVDGVELLYEGDITLLR